MIIICDIDGTIADVQRRLKIAGKEPECECGDSPLSDVRHQTNCQPAKSAWVEKLQYSIDLDEPIHAMRDLLRVFVRQDIPIAYVTGRSKRYWHKTHTWILQHGFPMAPIQMRADDDWRPAAKYKEEVTLKLTRHFSPPVIVLDDDGTGGDCAEMYKKNGWLHLRPTNNLTP